MDSDKGLFSLDALRGMYTLAIHIFKLSHQRQGAQLLTYSVPEFHSGYKVIVRNHVKDVWDPKYDVAYHMACVKG